MPTPDLRSLYGLDRRNAPDGLDSPPMRMAQWTQRPTPMRGAPFGLRPPLPFPPIPTRPEDVVEIPNPHLERFVPESTRNLWTLLALVPQVLWRQGIGPNGGAEESNELRQPDLPPEPPKRGNPLPWYVGPPVLEEEKRRQSGPDNSDPTSSEQPDPNFRQLLRVPIDSERAGGSEVEAGRKRLPSTEAPPLVPDQAPPRIESDAAVSGGGSGGGADGGSGSGGDDNERRRECTERWIDEKLNWCPQFWLAGRDYVNECKDRADQRLTQCHGNVPEVDRFDWRQIDPKVVKRIRRRMESKTKRKTAKSKKKS